MYTYQKNKGILMINNNKIEVNQTKHTTQTL